MATSRYVELIDESVKATKDFLARHELLHYFPDPDKSQIDGTRAEKDGLEPHKVYYLSSYSTLLQVKEMIHEEHKTGKALPIVLGKESTSDMEGHIDDLLELLNDKKKSKRGGIKLITNLDDIPKEDRKMVHDALKEIIEKISKEEEEK